MRIIVLLIALLSNVSYACELTDAYKEARVQAYEDINKGYRSCKASARAYFYYKAVARCVAEGRGENVMGGCYHIADRERPSSEKYTAHCSVLKPSTEQIKEYFNSMVEEQKIPKCSN